MYAQHCSYDMLAGRLPVASDSVTAGSCRSACTATQYVGQALCSSWAQKTSPRAGSAALQRLFLQGSELPRRLI